MGKAKKLKLSQAPRNTPLRDQIKKDEFATASSRIKDRSSGRQDEDEFVDSRLSKQILNQAKSQMLELEQELSGGVIKKKLSAPKLTMGRRTSDDESDEDDDASDNEGQEGRRDDQLEDFQIDPRDESAFNAFMDTNTGPRKTLADLIAEKINEKRTEIETQFSDAGGSFQAQDIDPKVIEMYQGVGQILSKYRSGKVPKAFKVIAQFRNWEDLLMLTEPERWSAAAVYQATRIFTSSLKEKMAQRFFNQILLPRVRDDIDTYQRLNFHLFQAIRKALFKPGAFFKGFLLPLCESRTCTLREAVIIGSVLSRNSIPVLHSSAVMLKIAEMEYSGANSIFLRIFFDKKYAMPYRVIDAVVFHFLRFRNEKRELPVLWHQAFLTFVQRYKSHISTEQKDALIELLKHQTHHQISAEIRRELVNAKCRDVEMDEPVDEPMM